MRLLRLDKRFWVIVTCIIVAFTVFVVGRNLLHAIRIRSDIRSLERERDRYRRRIAQDSALLEELRYDDRLERFARERYRMQRRGETVYIVEE
ncbi:MAG: septum formation initiator family protein [Alistipes sp.]|nr:septum formation initiator family protein [Alistipes sp.]MDE7069559.1 septum formation initiator family protein [Alistipes sp.]